MVCRVLAVREVASAEESAEPVTPFPEVEAVLADFAGSADLAGFEDLPGSADREDFEDFGQPDESAALDDSGAAGEGCRDPVGVVVTDGGRYESGDGTYDEGGGAYDEGVESSAVVLSRPGLDEFVDVSISDLDSVLDDRLVIGEPEWLPSWPGRSSRGVESVEPVELTAPAESDVDEDCSPGTG